MKKKERQTYASLHHTHNFKMLCCDFYIDHCFTLTSCIQNILLTGLVCSKKATVLRVMSLLTNTINNSGTMLNCNEFRCHLLVFLLETQKFSDAIPAFTPALLTYFIDFLIPGREIPGKMPRLAKDYFCLRYLQYVVHHHPSIRRRIMWALESFFK